MAAARTDHALVAWPEVNLEAQYAVFEGGRGVAQHGVILKVGIGGFNKTNAFGTFDRWEPTLSHGIGAQAKALNHLLGVKCVHESDARG